MKSFTGFGGVVRALRHRDFAIYITGNSISLIGSWMQRLATGWLAWELTGSGTWLGLIAFADLFPTLVVGPIAGAAADRWNRLYVTRTTQSLALCQATALYLFTATGQMTIWVLCGLTAIGGTIAAFNQPARLALVPSLVPRSDVVAAVAITSIAFNLARFIGPAIAGLMIVTTGLAAAFAANAITYAAFLLALAFLRAAPSAKTKEQGSFLQQVLEGMRYAGSHRGIAAILLLTIVASICTKPLVELLPGFAAEVFRSGADGLAMLTSSVGIGAVAGGFWLSGRPHSLGLTRVALGSSLAMAIAGALFTITDRLWVAVPLLAVVGFCMSSMGIASQTLVQMAVPGSMRGRVLSLYGLIARGGPALGALAMGVASEAVGFRWPIAVAALLAAAASAFFLMRQDAFKAELERQNVD